jgi:hypothetical protein
MPRVHMVHTAGAQSLSAACATPLRINSVVSRGVAPKGVPLALPPRFHGRAPSKSGAMGSLCDTLSVYGCNVNPMRAGTTGGHGQVISRRVKL